MYPACSPGPVSIKAETLMSLWPLAAPGKPGKLQRLAPHSPLHYCLFTFTATLTHVTSRLDSLSTSLRKILLLSWGTLDGRMFVTMSPYVHNVLDLVKQWYRNASAT